MIALFIINSFDILTGQGSPLNNGWPRDAPSPDFKLQVLTHCVFLNKNYLNEETMKRT